MKCPYCDKEMEPGYIQCRDSVTWTPKKCLVAALSRLSRGSVALSSGAAVQAYRCGDCKKVIIDVPEELEDGLFF